jgi:hypothetical protein
MTTQRRPLTGRDAAGAGGLPTAVKVLLPRAGPGFRAILGVLVPPLLAGFLLCHKVGIDVVTNRFRKR